MQLHEKGRQGTCEAVFRYIVLFESHPQDLGKTYQRLDARIPRLYLERAGQLTPFRVRVTGILQPAIRHATPCHHALAETLRAYIDAEGIAEDRKGWLFRTAPRHKADALTDRAMNQSDAWLMIRRPAAGITAPIGNHTFRATGITAYLANGGALEHAQQMAAHESPRTRILHSSGPFRASRKDDTQVRKANQVPSKQSASA